MEKQNVNILKDSPGRKLFGSAVDPKLFFSDPDPNFLRVLDPDPTFQKFWIRIRFFPPFGSGCDLNMYFFFLNMFLKLLLLLF
jgi:hypothetical protein